MVVKLVKLVKFNFVELVNKLNLSTCSQNGTRSYVGDTVNLG